MTKQADRASRVAKNRKGNRTGRQRARNQQAAGDQNKADDAANLADDAVSGGTVVTIIICSFTNRALSFLIMGSTSKTSRRYLLNKSK